MKKDEKEKLAQLKKAELEEEVAKRKKELAKLKIDRAMERLSNPHAIKQKRKEIAFLKTKIREKELNIVND